MEDAPGVSGSAQRSPGLNLLGWLNRARHWLRPNSVRTSRRNTQEYYDLSNAFFATFPA